MATDDDVLARLDAIEKKLDRILALLAPGVTYTPGPGQISGGLRAHEGQVAR